jgi:hypothetical protein
MNACYTEQGSLLASSSSRSAEISLDCKRYPRPVLANGDRALNSRGDTVACMSSENVMKLFDTRDWSEKVVFTCLPCLHFQPVATVSTSVALSPNCDFLAILWCDSRSLSGVSCVDVFSASTGRFVGRCVDQLDNAIQHSLTWSLADEVIVLVSDRHAADKITAVVARNVESIAAVQASKPPVPAEPAPSQPNTRQPPPVMSAKTLRNRERRQRRKDCKVEKERLNRAAAASEALGPSFDPETGRWTYNTHNGLPPYCYDSDDSWDKYITIQAMVYEFGDEDEDYYARGYRDSFRWHAPPPEPVRQVCECWKTKERHLPVHISRIEVTGLRGKQAIRVMGGGSVVFVGFNASDSAAIAVWSLL